MLVQAKMILSDRIGFPFNAVWYCLARIQGLWVRNVIDQLIKSYHKICHIFMMLLNFKNMIAKINAWKCIHGMKVIKLNTTLTAIFFSSSLNLHPLYKLQTSLQFNIFRCGGLNCVDVCLTSPGYLVAMRLEIFMHLRTKWEHKIYR